MQHGAVHARRSLINGLTDFLINNNDIVTSAVDPIHISYTIVTSFETRVEMCETASPTGN